MQADANNPSAASAVPSPAHDAPAANPFQAAPSRPDIETSPFAEVGNESPFGLIEPRVGKPAKLPERRLPSAHEDQETGQMLNKVPSTGAHGLNEVAASPFELAAAPEASPFELAAAPQASPFDPVVGVPAEGFLADRGDTPESFAPPAADLPAFEPVPSAAPQNGCQSAPQAPVELKGAPQHALRAAFGVTHELTAEKVLQCVHTLPEVDESNHRVRVKIALMGPSGSGKSDILRALSSSKGSGPYHSQKVGETEVCRCSCEWTGMPAPGWTLDLTALSTKGEVHFNAVSEMLLDGVDGIIFVIPIDSSRASEVRESLQTLSFNMSRYGRNLGDIAVTMHYHGSEKIPDFDPAILDAFLGINGDAISRFVTRFEGDDLTCSFASVVEQVVNRINLPEGA
ncbi:MAG: hypothetical protein ACN4GG_03775 [Akkermansiaceae bacterium]